MIQFSKPANPPTHLDPWVIQRNPYPHPPKTRTHGRGYGLSRVRVRVALNYPWVTRDNPYSVRLRSFFEVTGYTLRTSISLYGVIHTSTNVVRSVITQSYTSYTSDPKI